jgi:hypothetical protein
MHRNVTAPSAKPQLERLEGRDLPSFLLNGSTNLLLTPLRNMVQDMRNTENDLSDQKLAGKSSLREVGKVFGPATSDYQRMLTDKAAVDALSTQDLAFLNAAALAEAAAGDGLDLVILTFGPLLHFPDFRAPFNDVRAQADHIIGEKRLRELVNFSVSFSVIDLGARETFGPIADQTVTPQVEPLGGRDLPSFLFNGGANLLLNQLKSMVQDMQNTQTDLQTQVGFLHNHTPPVVNNAAQLGQIGQAFGKATADWQRMLTDKAAVDALSTQELAFLNAAALAEASEGDGLDFFVLTYASFFNFPDPKAPFNQVRTQADNIIAGSTVQAEVGFNFSFYALSPRDNEKFGPIAAQTALPTF